VVDARPRDAEGAERQPRDHGHEDDAGPEQDLLSAGGQAALVWSGCGHGFSRGSIVLKVERSNNQTVAGRLGFILLDLFTTCSPTWSVAGDRSSRL